MKVKVIPRSNCIAKREVGLRLKGILVLKYILPAVFHSVQNPSSRELHRRVFGK